MSRLGRHGSVALPSPARETEYAHEAEDLAQGDGELRCRVLMLFTDLVLKKAPSACGDYRGRPNDRDLR